MKTDLKPQQINAITEKVICCANKVSNKLGSGFLEKVYENALALEIQMAGLKVEQQHPIQIYNEGTMVGDYTSDLLVEGCVINEIKTVTALNNIHQAQCLNYLKATGFQVCLLVNFYNPKVEIKRIVNNFPL